MPNTAGYTKVTSAVIKDSEIVNADISSSAAIAYSKLNSGAVDDDIIPDGDGTRALGDSTHNFSEINVNDIQGAAQGQILIYSLLGGLT